MSEYHRRRKVLDTEFVENTMHGSTPGKVVLVIKVEYELGGMTFDGARTNQRGYYLRVARETQLDNHTHIIGLDGSTPSVSMLLSAAPRFSERKLAEMAQGVTAEQIQTCKDAVAKRYQEFLDRVAARR